ncbi:MAG: hemerythrin domain-containing protein [Bacteroidales bacterium]|nr:hemerythrin domain-containing protein [Bacteroidales bacterium]
MQITRSMKMADMIHMNYLLLPIISRFNIKLGCGDKSIDQVCKENSIDVYFFLEIVNSFHDKNYFPKKQLQGFPLKLIVDYLRNSHEHYLHVKVPYIEDLIHQLLLDSYSGNTELSTLINKFFNDYKSELEDHINREEIKVYPYVFAIEKAFRSKKPSPDIIELTNKYSMDDFIHEHDNIEDKLFDLKNLIIKYIPPPEDIHLCNTILIELFRLEADLNDHARIEDKVLVPKVKFMEKWIYEHVLQ